MTHEELRERARQQPFRPFRVILTTGAGYDIRHPDLIMVGRRSAALGVTNEPGGSSYDRVLVVDLCHIVGVEEPPGAAGANGPGQ